MKTTTLIARVKHRQLFLDMGQKSGKQQLRWRNAHTLTGTFTPPQRLRVACAHRAADCRGAHPRVLYFAQNEAEKRFHLRCVASGTAPTRVDAEQEEEAAV